MAEIFMQDRADFLGVNAIVVNRACLWLKDFPKPTCTRGPESRPIRIWTYAQYEAYVAQLGGQTEAIKIFMKASSEYNYAKHLAKNHSTKKSTKGEYKPRYYKAGDFWCASCNQFHPDSMKAKNSRRSDICEKSFIASVSKRQRNSMIVRREINVLDCMA